MKTRTEAAGRDGAMKDHALLRDMVRSSGQHATHVDAREEVMRLSQDPLLLYEYLQARERNATAPEAVIAAARRQGHLHRLPALPLAQDPPRRLATTISEYAKREMRMEPSLRPEIFAASMDDRALAIESEAASPDSREADPLNPGNFIGEVLILFGIVLAGAAILDFLTF